MLVNCSVSRTSQGTCITMNRENYTYRLPYIFNLRGLFGKYVDKAL